MIIASSGCVRSAAALLAAATLCGCASGDHRPARARCEPDLRGIQPPVAEPLALGSPTGFGASGFDDLSYSPSLRRLVVAHRREGAIYLVDPETRAVRVARGVGDDIASADAGGGLVFGASRTANRVVIVDPASMTVVAHLSVGGEPDYVRFSPETDELWVTEPDLGRIEVLSLTAGSPPALRHSRTIDTPRGPEGLVFDSAGRAYTQDADSLVVIDVHSHEVIARWRTGCDGHHGFPQVDPVRHLVFAGCARGGAAVVLDSRDGRRKTTHRAGGGETVLAYAPRLGHFYLRGDPSPSVSMLGVCDDGAVTRLAQPAIVPHGHVMAADELGNVWLADPAAGGLLRIADPYPAMP